jgi:hypothetical protein
VLHDLQGLGSLILIMEDLSEAWNNADIYNMDESEYAIDLERRFILLFRLIKRKYSPNKMISENGLFLLNI